MALDKRALTIDDIDSQAGFELPARETMLVTIVITNLLNGNTVNVEVKNNNVAVQVCAVVDVLSAFLSTPLSCAVQQ